MFLAQLLIKNVVGRANQRVDIGECLRKRIMPDGVIAAPAQQAIEDGHLDGAGKTRERSEPATRNAGSGRQGDAEFAYGFQPLQRLHERGATHPGPDLCAACPATTGGCPRRP